MGFNFKPQMSSQDSANWNDEFFEIAEIASIEKFWLVQNHISVPDKISHKSRPNIYLFKQGIKTTWEAAQNVGGGSWTVILPKAKRFEYLNRLWFEMLLAVIGNAFPADFDDRALQYKIGNWMKETMNLCEGDTIKGTPFDNGNADKNMSFLYRSTNKDTYSV